MPDRACPQCGTSAGIYPLNWHRWLCPACSISFMPQAIGGRPRPSDGVVRAAPSPLGRGLIAPERLGLEQQLAEALARAEKAEALSDRLQAGWDSNAQVGLQALADLRRTQEAALGLATCATEAIRRAEKAEAENARLLGTIQRLRAAIGRAHPLRLLDPDEPDAGPEPCDCYLCAAMELAGAALRSEEVGS